MKTPKKIYLYSYSTDGIYEVETKPLEGTVEYTRTNAFIEKACEWIETNMDDYIHVEYDTVTGKPTNEAHIAHKKVVEDFINYMKGE